MALVSDFDKCPEVLLDLYQSANVFFLIVSFILLQEIRIRENDTGIEWGWAVCQIASIWIIFRGASSVALAAVKFPLLWLKRFSVVAAFFMVPLFISAVSCVRLRGMGKSVARQCVWWRVGHRCGLSRRETYVKVSLCLPSYRARCRVRQKNMGSRMGCSPKVTLAIHPPLFDMWRNLKLKKPRNTSICICLFVHTLNFIVWEA